MVLPRTRLLSNWRKNNLWSLLGIKVLDGCVKQRKNGVFEVCETNFVRTRLKSTRPPFSVFFREWISETSCFITLKNRTTCKFLFWHQGCLFYQEAVREFAYGQQYAWMLVIFTLMVVFCLTCPLVTPFGKSRKTFSSRLQTFIMAALHTACEHERRNPWTKRADESLGWARPLTEHIEIRTIGVKTID